MSTAAPVPEILERDEIIEAIPAALVCGEHILMIGPPGIAKSLLARAACKAVKDATYFEHLLTRFSGPEELFGPISIQKLKEEKHFRNYAGYLPTAHIAFIDEIWKANSAILNATLTVLNERKFHNSGEAVDCPLITCFAASNEYEEDESLVALRDRFLMTFEVERIRGNSSFTRMLDMPDGIPDIFPDKFTVAELLQKRAELSKVTMNYDPIMEIRGKLQAKNIHPSDRTWRKAVRLCKATALLSGRTEVDQEDLGILKNVLWRDPQDRKVVRAIIGEKADPSIAKLSAIEEVVGSMHKKIVDVIQSKQAGRIKNDEVIKVAKEVNKQVSGQQNLIKPLKNHRSPKTKKAAAQLDEAIENIKRMVSDVLGMDIGPTASNFLGD